MNSFNKTLADLSNMVSSMTEKELIEVNKLVIKTIKQNRMVKTEKRMEKFRPGDHVEWVRDDNTSYGIIVKLNTKTIHVLDDSGDEWNISPHLLNRSKKITKKEPQNKKELSNIINLVKTTPN